MGRPKKHALIAADVVKRVCDRGGELTTDMIMEAFLEAIELEEVEGDELEGDLGQLTRG